VDGWNITRDSVGAGQDKIVANLIGNRISSYSLPSGVNKCIGTKEDLLRNRIYFFVWNSNNNHSILYYDRVTDVVYKLLESKTDSGGVDILLFNPNFRINHVDIIYRDASEGDLIFWTDFNERPFFINELTAISNLYGTSWLYDYITVARPMPIIQPVAIYANDATYNINNLIKKVYEFRYRWIYKDLTESTWSPYSKIPAPFNPDDIAVETDPTKNNRINVRITTGNKDVLKLEIAARNVVATIWSDDFSVVVLDKAALAITDNSFYTYPFYSDGSYVYVDKKDSILNFDFVPKKARTQVLANGNVLVYGAITELYNKLSSISVTSSTTTILNPNTTPLNKYDEIVGRTYRVYFFGLPTIGDVIQIHVDGDNGDTNNYSYTTILSDTATLVRDALVTIINTASPAYGFSATAITDASGNPGIRIQHIGLVFVTGTTTITYATPIAPTEVSNSCYRPTSRYKFGLVYFDKYGVNIGVETSDNMNIVTLEVDTTGQSQPKITAISFSINHQPPTYAYYYAFVRTSNLTTVESQYIVTQDTLKDTVSATPEFGYMNISNIQSNDNKIPIISFQKGDRVRIIKGTYSNAFTAVKDLPVIDLLVDADINGSTVTGSWLKIPYTADMVNWGTVGYEHYWIEVYTPALNVSTDQQLYYEFGEIYEVGDPTLSTRYHFGQIQNQIVGTQPATFTFTRGDYYIRQRKNSITSDPSFTVSYWIYDQSISDKFPSKIAGNGRSNIIDVNAKETYFPSTVRFSNEYQQNTNINRTNRFYAENLDDYDRSSGDIMKLFVEGRRMYVLQQFDIGVVPVLQQIVKTASGDSLLTQNDTLLNKIQYPYQNKLGIGNVPESFSFHENSIYGIDNNKGVAWRLSQNGQTELSVIYECDSFFKAQCLPYATTLNNGNPQAGQSYLGNPTIYGGFDRYTNKVIWCFEEINRYNIDGILIYHKDPSTIIFNETRDTTEGFECFASFYPENIESLGTLIATFKDGQIWTHDASGYNTFYGTPFDSSITAVFRGNEIEKKSFISLMETANEIWDCPTIETQLISHTNVTQLSKLITQNFKRREGQYHSPLLRDINSIGGWINGSSLKGNYIKIKFRNAITNKFVFLSAVVVKFNNSQLNNK
jgi:hypothetical protein